LFLGTGLLSLDPFLFQRPVILRQFYPRDESPILDRYSLPSQR
jgi:hypothetical protein